jgi:hypothetical protein
MTKQFLKLKEAVGFNLGPVAALPTGGISTPNQSKARLDGGIVDQDEVEDEDTDSNEDEM